MLYEVITTTDGSYDTFGSPDYDLNVSLLASTFDPTQTTIDTETNPESVGNNVNVRNNFV